MRFRQQVEALSGQNVNACFQCSKCSSGCPLGDRMDLKPAQVMHAIRLGLRDEVLNSQAIWICVGCETCSARCPQDVEPSAAMNAARILAKQAGLRPGAPDVSVFYDTFVANLRLTGRIHDASLAAVTRLRNGHPFDDMPLVWQLLVRGRIKPPRLPLGGNPFRRIDGRLRAEEEEAPA